MRQMRQKTVERLEDFFNALTLWAQGPRRLVEDPFKIAARHGAGKQTACGMIDVLNRAGYLITITASDRGRPIMGVSLTGKRWNVTDFTRPKPAAKERKQKSVPISPALTSVSIRKPRVVVFIDCDNLCIKLQRRNSVLEVDTILRKAAEEGDFVACFGFVQRKTLERHREAINGFPKNMPIIMSPDYAQAADEQMLDMIKLFAIQNAADVFFIGTADQLLFESAQKIVNDAKKRAALLDCCELSVGIKSEADRIVRIQNAIVPLTKQRLQQCAERIAKTKHLGRGREAEFLRNVVRKLRLILSGDANERGEEFGNLQNRVWHWLHQRGETIGWVPQDCKFALEVLRTLDILTTHRDADERTRYRLNREAATYGVF